MSMGGAETPLVPMKPVPLHAPAPKQPQAHHVFAKEHAHTHFILKGFRNSALDEVYTANAEYCVGGHPTYWNSAANHFMYFQQQETRWVITPRYNGQEQGRIDLLAHVMRGEMRGVAFEGVGSVWQEFAQGAWHPVQIEFIKLLELHNSKPTRSSMPFPALSQGGSSSGSRAQEPVQRAMQSGQPKQRTPASSSTMPTTQRTQQAAAAQGQAVGQVVTVVIQGFRNECLNTTFYVDRVTPIGGRSTYWDRDCRYFMYYQASEKRWAISCRDTSSGGDDLLLDAQRGGIRGLAFEGQKGGTKWQEFFEGKWITVEPRIEKLSETDSTPRPLVVPHTQPREPVVVIKLEDESPLPCHGAVTPGLPVKMPWLADGGTTPQISLPGMVTPSFEEGGTTPQLHQAASVRASCPRTPSGTRADAPVETEVFPPSPQRGEVKDGVEKEAETEVLSNEEDTGKEEEEEDSEVSAKEAAEARKKRKQEKKEKKEKKAKKLEQRLRKKIVKEMQTANPAPAAKCRAVQGNKVAARRDPGSPKHPASPKPGGMAARARRKGAKQATGQLSDQSPGSKTGDQADLLHLLPDDVPADHEAHEKVKRVKTQANPCECFKFQSAAGEYFQTTTKRALGSAEAAGRIARLLFVMVADGATKEEAIAYRSVLYGKLSGATELKEETKKEELKEELKEEVKAEDDAKPTKKRRLSTDGPAASSDMAHTSSTHTPSQEAEQVAEPEQNQQEVAEAAGSSKVEPEASEAAEPPKKRVKAAVANEPTDGNVVPSGDDPIEYVQPNPKRAGTASGDRYALYMTALTVNEALSMGSAPGDIPHDFKRGLLKRRMN